MIRFQRFTIIKYFVMKKVIGKNELLNKENYLLNITFKYPFYLSLNKYTSINTKKKKKNVEI